MKYILTLLLILCSSAYAGLTDIKFGQAQIADSQWNVNACLNTTSCQIYSKNPGTMYKIPWTTGQWNWQQGQYVQFSLTGNASYPYEGKVYNSNGTLAGTIGIGKIVNMGPDYFFFVGNDNNTGQLFSGSSGMNNTNGVSWTGTLNPTTAQADTYANASYSTVPLLAGQTATQTPNSGGGNQVAQNPRPTWPVINRAANQIQFGSGRTGGWVFNWWDSGGSVTGGHIGSVNWWSAGTGSGYHNYLYSWMRWPGTDNGISRTIWFRTGYDDGHALYINGQLVASGNCCYFAYGSYTAKPGEILKLEFYSDNYGGGGYSGQVAWDPDGDGVYELLDSNTVAINDPAGPGGSAYWYSSDITTTQNNIISTARTARDNILFGNRIDIETKIGTVNPIVTIEQSGNFNKIQGLGGGYAIIDGDNNTLNIKQGSVTSGRNLIEFGIYGDTNNVTLWQSRNITTGLEDGLESGGHYIGLGINGNSNTVNVKQTNAGAVNSGHFGLMYILGDNNNMTLRQAGNSDKKAFINVDGSNNSSNVYQHGTGNHYVDLYMLGNGHTANITQSGFATHKATINLQNAGGSSILNLIQQGTSNQHYSIVQQCANLNGCTVSVTQGGP